MATLKANSVWGFVGKNYDDNTQSIGHKPQIHGLDHENTINWLHYRLTASLLMLFALVIEFVDWVSGGSRGNVRFGVAKMWNSFILHFIKHLQTPLSIINLYNIGNMSCVMSGDHEEWTVPEKVINNFCYSTSTFIIPKVHKSVINQNNPSFK